MPGKNRSNLVESRNKVKYASAFLKMVFDIRIWGEGSL